MDTTDDIHGPVVTGDSAISMIAHFASLLAHKCPDCTNEVCVFWTYKFVLWALETVLDNKGPMAVLLALVNRGGEAGVTLTAKELKEIQGTKKVMVITNPVTGDMLIRIIDRNTGSVPKDDTTAADDTEWPALLSD